MEDNSKILGELGEVMTVDVASVKPEGEEQHFSVAIELDGFTLNEDGAITIILSPSESERLSKRLMEVSGEAYQANAPF